MTKAESTLQFIQKHNNAGRTIYICTAYTITKATPNTVKKWKDAGQDLFFLDSTGDLRMRSGKNSLVICCKNTSLVTIKAA